MLRHWHQLRAGVPTPFLSALALGAGFLAFVAWDQSHWWRIKEDYSFGWLVPVFVVFVLHDRWPKISAAVAACASPDGPRAAGWRKWLLWLLVAGSLALGIAMFLLGAFYRAGAGTSQPGTLALTLGAAGILLPMIFIHAPAAGPGQGAEGEGVIAGGGGRRGGIVSDVRVRLTALFIFPVLVWLVSAPMVSAHRRFSFEAK